METNGYLPEVGRAQNKQMWPAGLETKLHFSNCDGSEMHEDSSWAIFSPGHK